MEVPFAEDIQIDGQTGDWRQVGVDQGRLPAAEDHHDAGPDDLDARLSLAWNDQGLLVLVQVIDDVVVESAGSAELYLQDSVELFMVDGANKVQHVIAPGIAAGVKGPRLQDFDHRQNAQLKRAHPARITAKARKTNGGYTVEALLPWDVLDIDPRVGTRLRVQVMVNDADSPTEDRTIYAWYPKTQTYRDSRMTHRIRLSPTQHSLALARD